jgi:uncharacterized protein YciI
MNERAQYLYRVSPTRLQMLTEGPTSNEEKIVGEHFSYLKDLKESGVVILVGRTTNDDETTFGVIIFNANSVSEATKIMNADPAVLEGVMTAELFPYRVALICEANI